MTRHSPYKDTSTTSRQISVARCLKGVIATTLFLVVFLKSTRFQSLSMFSNNKKQRANHHHHVVVQRDTAMPKQSLRIAFVGNSILFANDSPGLLVRLLEESGKYDLTFYETCMEGGMSLVSLWSSPIACNPTLVIGSDKQMTMDKLLEGYWDYVILNDQTRAPANPETHQETMKSLTRLYAPHLCNVQATPILLQTVGYRLGYPEFGSFEEFTNLLHDGYHQYADLLTKYFHKQCGPNQGKEPVEARVSPVGDVFAQVKLRNLALWERLYMEDGVHPSALGTWLQVCVLYVTMFKEEPPTYDRNFWTTKSGRLRTADALPTKTEATELWTIALIATGIMDDQYYVDHS
jgi:hypothetical protein